MPVVRENWSERLCGKMKGCLPHEWKGSIKELALKDTVTLYGWCFKFRGMYLKFSNFFFFTKSASLIVIYWKVGIITNKYL